MVLKRSRTWWNSRTVILTMPDNDHDTVHMNFLEGTQNYYHVACHNPDCHHSGPLTFAHLKAKHPLTHQCCKWSDVPDVLDHDKKWDFEALAPHLRYVCPACGHLHRDEPVVRRRMAAEGTWVSHNLKAPPRNVSYNAVWGR